MALRKKYVNQAVLLADSFNRRYSPITLDVPRALVPLVNVPLIDYTIELLVSAGIERIFIFCVAHADKLQAHISASHWAQSGVQFRVIVSNQAKSVGDALRRVHTEQVIESDFVLVHGDVVGHMDLAAVLDGHRRRKEKDPTTLMTTVYKRATPTHASRSLEDDTIVGVTADNEILFWENQPTSSSVEVDPMLIMGDAKGALRMHYDLLDTHVDVCAAEVLQLFQDNFDYQNVRADFMTGVLGDDITDNKLFAHIVQCDYAARVKDLRTYASVSRDVVHRWAAPVVPDNPLLLPLSTYRMQRGLVYRERNVKTLPSTVLGPGTVVGGGTTIGARTVLRKSVVGRDCKIGQNCRIVNSFIWAGAVIADDCVVEWSIVCTGARLHAGVTLGRGCVVSYGVQVGPNVALKPHTRLTRQHVTPAAMGVPDSEEVTRNIDLGDQGAGVLWVLKEEEESNALHASGKRLELGDSDVDVDTVGGSSDAPDDAFAGASGTDDESSEIGNGGGTGTDFDMEVREIVLDGVRAGSAIDNIGLEINGRKFAHDKSFFDCARAVLWALMASVPATVEPGKPLLSEFQKLLKTWHGLLGKFVTTAADQTELLWTLQEYVEFKDHARYSTVFQFIVHSLYDQDVIEEEAVWAWEKEQQTLVGPDRKYLEQCAKFLSWLKEADSSSE